MESQTDTEVLTVWQRSSGQKMALVRGYPKKAYAPVYDVMTQVEDPFGNPHWVPWRPYTPMEMEGGPSKDTINLMNVEAKFQEYCRIKWANVIVPDGMHEEKVEEPELELEVDDGDTG